MPVIISMDSDFLDFLYILHPGDHENLVDHPEKPDDVTLRSMGYVTSLGCTRSSLSPGSNKMLPSIKKMK